jgi:hypothetical protein
MDSLKNSVENLTGMLSVGSLCLLGAFLFLDGRTAIFHVLETHGKSTAWAVVVAIPTFVTGYVVGMFAVTAATLILSRIRWLYRPEDRSGLIVVARFGNEVSTSRYLDLSRQRRLLEGGTIGFLSIAIGAWSEAASFPEFRSLGQALGAGALTLALLCPFFSAMLAREERFLVAEVTRLLEHESGRKSTVSDHQEGGVTADVRANTRPAGDCQGG